MNKCIKATISLSFLISMNASAYYVDFQGVSNKTTVQSKHQVAPDGFVFFTDKFKGAVIEIGKGSRNKISTFGVDDKLENAIGFIVPKDWITYIDSEFSEIPRVSWDFEQLDWVNALATLGNENGLRFIVDHDQRVLQIEKEEGFIKPDFNQPLVMESSSGEQIFIYKQEKEVNSGGYILVDGELVKVKVSD